MLPGVGMAYAQRIRSAKELGVRMPPIGMVRERDG
jgi:hypothetical protein